MTEKEKFLVITRKTYVEQAKWFLNGFWNDLQAEAEQVWKYTQKFIELDPKKKTGNELDEFWSHKFLESWGETLTVIALRERLKKIDLDANGKMSLMEYLIFRYGKTVPAVISAPQGDNTEEIDKCTKKLNAVNDALQELQKKLEEQRIALEAAKKRTAELHEAETKAKKLEEELSAALSDLEKREAAVRAAEEEVRKAEEELRGAVNDLTAQETAYKTKCEDLQAKSQDASATQVNRAKAAAELAQLKQENPLPLRKAKLTQEAALRKVEKQRKEAEQKTAEAKAATEQAAKARSEAEAQRKEVEHQKSLALKAEAELKEITVQVENQMAETQKAYDNAVAELEEAKKKAGDSKGSLWWLGRELQEAKRYLPKSKQ